MADPYAIEFDNLRFRREFGVMLGMRMTSGARTRPKGEFHAGMAERWIEHAQRLGREPYLDGRGFTRDRWQLSGTSRVGSAAGREKPYGLLSRALWKYMRLAIREAFLAGWHEAQGTTMPDHRGARNSLHLTRITGLS